MRGVDVAMPQVSTYSRWPSASRLKNCARSASGPQRTAGTSLRAVGTSDRGDFAVRTAGLGGPPRVAKPSGRGGKVGVLAAALLGAESSLLAAALPLGVKGFGRCGKLKAPLLAAAGSPLGVYPVAEVEDEPADEERCGSRCSKRQDGGAGNAAPDPCLGGLPASLPSWPRSGGTRGREGWSVEMRGPNCRRGSEALVVGSDTNAGGGTAEWLLLREESRLPDEMPGIGSFLGLLLGEAMLCGLEAHTQCTKGTMIDAATRST